MCPHIITLLGTILRTSLAHHDKAPISEIDLIVSADLVVVGRLLVKLINEVTEGDS